MNAPENAKGGLAAAQRKGPSTALKLALASRLASLLGHAYVRCDRWVSRLEDQRSLGGVSNHGPKQ